MKAYEIRFTKEARKDVRKLSPKLRQKLRDVLLEVVRKDPHAGKSLVGDLSGFYFIRLTYRDRVVYTIDKRRRTVFVHRARTHYGE